MDNMHLWLEDGQHIELRGFGSFGTKNRKSRYGFNPQNKERILIPGHSVVYFKPGKELKEKIKYAGLKKK